MPAQPETIAAFVDAMAASRAAATGRRYVASIAAAHRALGRGKAAKSVPVRLALKRMHRRRGRRQTQGWGLTWPLRQRLLAAAGERPIDDRNPALVAVAYDAMLRRSELIGLQVNDLFDEIDGSGALLVRRSKTDPEGRGAMVYLAPDTVALVRAWRVRAGVSDGRLFAVKNNCLYTNPSPNHPRPAKSRLSTAFPCCAVGASRLSGRPEYGLGRLAPSSHFHPSGWRVQRP